MVRCLLPLLLAVLASQAGAQDTPRLQTSRAAGAGMLKLPKEEDAFGFVVFGDRTGGPAEGIAVLEQAVTDTNLLDPDLVMTVGDLVNGYNGHDEWHTQAAEYRAAMGKLRMPWFPVAGNHDVYWRGPGKPEGEHERDFETVFGPLWYAFRHKQCWFVVLYSDEGDPKTGKKDFNDPECQRMSDAQFAWLQETLQRARGARHVFVFLHHPRWLARYGTDWDRVHALLAKNGNVTAVFAGHIHRMRYDGIRDGIGYYTVASVGAHLEFEAPAAGFLHQFHVVTVRPEGITVAALPVGTVIDPQAITGDLSEDVDLVHERLRPVLADCASAGPGAPLQLDGAVDAVVQLRCENPGSRAIELEFVPAGDDTWLFAPDHQHVIVPPKASGTTTFAVRRKPAPGAPFVLPQLAVRCDYLAADRRIGLPRREFPLELPPPPDLGKADAAHEGVLVLDGKGSALRLPPACAVPDGPMTVEAWLCGRDFTGRRAVVAKTENSEFAIFCSDGQIDFSIWLGNGYASARSEGQVLEAGRWHHVAGVFDGSSVRCYVDGRLIASAAGTGARRTNTLPLLVGADPNGSGAATSSFDGRIDEVRISKTARHAGPSFEPPPRHEADADTVLLLHLDADFGPWTADSSTSRAHAARLGTAHCTVESRPAVR
jgi:3',5'-cyclic AMP phosphodiesterase CpdA